MLSATIRNTDLGRIVSKEGIRPDPVRQFVGLASYYCRFIPDSATIAHLLPLLTGKNAAFKWCSRTFQTLKEKLVLAPVLSYPRFGPDVKFILDTDASDEGLGLFFSLSVTKVRCTQLHMLHLGSVRYFRPYIHTTIYTAHAACMSLLKTARLSGKLARWALAIQEINLSPATYYEVIKGVLHYEPPTVPGRLCVMVPEALRMLLLKEAHVTNLASLLMEGVTVRYCHSCLVCSSQRGPGRPLPRQSRSEDHSTELE